jgi:hypothetical protein
MGSGKLSYAGIAGAVAGVVGLLGSVTAWYSLVIGNVGITVRGTGVNAGRLALAMSIALFAFSVAYVVMDDARIRRSMAALVIVTAVTLTMSFVWGIKDASGAGVGWGLWLTGLAGVLGIAGGLLAIKESPLGGDIADDGAAAEANPAEAVEPVTGSTETHVAS